MEHIRIPVSYNHPEAGWFGYLYFWRDMPNGAVGTRLQMNDPRLGSGLSKMEWDDTRGFGGLSGDLPVTLREDAEAIMHDSYPYLRRAGDDQVKSGRYWVGANSGIQFSKV